MKAASLKQNGASSRSDIALRLALARGATLKEIQEDPKFYINQAGIVKDADKLLKDGWGQPYEIVQDETRSDIVVRSAKLTEYLRSKGRDK